MTFNKCRKQYEYKYVQKLKPQARDQRFESWIRMSIGICGHAGLEALMLGQDLQQGVLNKIEEMCFGDVPSDFKAALNEKAGMISQIAQDAADWLPLSDWEPLSHKGESMVEAELRLPLEAPFTHWVGYADLVARHKPTGRVMVLDYKFRERFESEDSDRFNRQFAMYQHALNEMGITCHGSMLFEIKSSLPKRAPKVSHDDHGDISSVRTSVDGRFRTTPTYRSAQYVAALWEDTVKEVSVIGALSPTTVYRNMSAFGCKDCVYQRICQAELSGEDINDVTQSDYTLII